MNGYEYEYVVAAYLRQNGFYDVKVTKASGDYGVDVVARKGLQKYAVQCKYYTKPVGVGAVQEVVSGKAVYHCTAAMVVTNSRFTAAAERLAKSNGVILVPQITVQSTGFAASPLRHKMFWLLHLIVSGVLLKFWYNACKDSPPPVNYLLLLFFFVLAAYPFWVPKFWDWLLGRFGSLIHFPRRKPHGKTRQPKNNAFSARPLDRAVFVCSSYDRISFTKASKSGLAPHFFAILSRFCFILAIFRY